MDPHLLPSAPQKPHLSASSIKLYLECARKWAFKYVEGHRGPTGIGALLSKVWHKVAEINARQKITSGVDLSLEEMLDLYVMEYDAALQEEEVKLQVGETLEQGKDMGLKITEVHHLKIAPHVRPLLVEEEFNIDLGPEFPYTLKGFWDLVEEDGTIVDNKAFGRMVQQNDLDKDIQFSLYSLAYRVTRQTTEPGMRMDLLVKPRNKNHMPKAVQLYTQRTNVDARWILGLVEDVTKGIQRGVFPPNPTGFLCSPKYCDFWDRCKGKGKIAAASSAGEDDGE